MAQFRIACSQITYGPFKREDPDAWPEDRILAEIAAAGYAGATSGPRADRTPAETIAVYARHGLQPVSGYLGVDWWDPARREQILEQAQRLAEYHAAIGCDALYVAAGGFGYVSRATGRTRSQLAGHVGPGDGLTDDEWRRFADLLNEVGHLTLRQGVKSCFHNHVGSVVETRAEIERLLALTDPACVFLGPDTGHLAWPGADVVQFARDHAARIKTIHLKDVDQAVRDQCVAEEAEYRTFVDRGGWREIGDGLIDFSGLFDVLRAADFDGWVIVEIDRTIRATPAESAQISRTCLRSIGL